MTPFSAVIPSFCITFLIIKLREYPPSQFMNVHDFVSIRDQWDESDSNGEIIGPLVGAPKGLLYDINLADKTDKQTTTSQRSAVLRAH